MSTVVNQGQQTKMPPSTDWLEISEGGQVARSSLLLPLSTSRLLICDNEGIALLDFPFSFPSPPPSPLLSLLSLFWIYQITHFYVDCIKIKDFTDTVQSAFCTWTVSL